MQEISGFDPIAAPDARVLILGSMPSKVSKAREQYYGHSKNAFWAIMGQLFGAELELCYGLRKGILMTHRVALWDVLKTCQRLGSLDADIELDSIIVNDFSDFFRRHDQIRHVFFNGMTAEKIYRKYILPTLPERFGYLVYHRLPSTSPTNAALSLPQKMEAWQEIKHYLAEELAEG
ncbi:DNA-deoxyinosine glycosylase [Methylomicrobium lacus]|uniref:DNA-deoxyinosine glycosylase n=1 Tax=Methylomicrobium lacus TaxID=136992 RepID=UPI00045E8F18|nr:DNA-deoxyinosine glycosylase [Methylomicrobium lacus]